MKSYRSIDDKGLNINPKYTLEKKCVSLKVNGRKWPLLLGMLIMSFAIFIIDKEAFSATYFIDGSCANNGNGLADQCASSLGGAGAYQDPQSCLNAMVAGDTCLIKNGTYTTSYNGSAPGNAWIDGGYYFAHSGSPGNYITLKNYPGHSPVLRNAATHTTVAGTNPGHPTLTAANNNYLDIEGLHIEGAVYLNIDSAYPGTKTGFIFRNNDVAYGWGFTTDGNWAGLWLGNITAAQIDHNYFHDGTVPSDVADSSASCIKLYQNDQTIVQYNTCKHWNTHALYGTQAGGIDDKARSVNNIHRYNWIEDVKVCVRINNQLNGSNISVYGNVCYAQNMAIYFTTLMNGAHIYNNTLYGAAVCLYAGGPGISNVDFYNNICYLNDNAGENGNIDNYDTAILNIADYNRFTSGYKYRVQAGVTYSTLAAYQSGYGMDLHSSETPCTFVNPGTDFHLTGGCVGWGHVGGVSSGAPVDVGAYGVTSCVGWTCGRAVKISAPTGLKVQ